MKTTYIAIKHQRHPHNSKKAKDLRLPWELICNKKVFRYQAMGCLVKEQPASNRNSSMELKS
jgi:hypothetical protein